MPERAPIPTPERKPAWRATCLAYREKRRAGAMDHEGGTFSEPGGVPTVGGMPLPVGGVSALSHPAAIYVRRHCHPPGRLQPQHETLQSAVGTPSHATRFGWQGISRCTRLAQPSSDLVRPIEEAKGRRLVLRLVPKPAALTATQAVDAV